MTIALTATEVAPRTLAVEPLTREAFAPFGEVIEASDAVRHFTINGGNTERYHDLAEIDAGPDGKVIVSIFRGQPRALPFRVVVAPAGDAPTVQDLRVFLARGDQGVNYASGVWHHPLLALGAVCDFLVVDRGGNGPNCDEIQLETAGLIPALARTLEP